MLNALDTHLLNATPGQRLRGWPRFLTEFLYFGIKEARACLFVGLFFGAVFLVPRTGILGLPRYDVLLLAALAIQGAMIWAKLETWDELNGTEQQLADNQELAKTDDPELELKCKVYNINYGKNRAIMEKCRWLDEWFPSAGKYRGEQQDTADGY